MGGAQLCALAYVGFIAKIPVHLKRFCKQFTRFKNKVNEANMNAFLKN